MSGPTNTPSVAIIGRPNVGKSALYNRLVRRSTSIVHDQPGVTRDRISGVCTRGNRPFKIWDTGGVIGAGETELTREVHRVVQETIRDSDLLLLIVDAKHGLSPMDEELGRALRRADKPILLVINKIDDDKHEDRAIEFDSLGFDTGISISAAHGRGILELLERIEEKLANIPAAGSNKGVTASGRQMPTVTAGSRHSLLEDAGIAIAIIGRPNVGKSSFINAILKSERSIVSELAGTTRDAVDISYQHGERRFVFIDTAGIRRRGAHSTSVEVFSVMRAERSIRRADLCVLIVDLTSGVTAQDKRIAGLIQEARKAGIVILNKWDLVKPRRGSKETVGKLADEARDRIFFLDYAPVLVASAKTGENVERLFRLIDKVRGAARRRIGTGVLNRLLRDAFAANPPPMVSGKRLKLFYAAQASGEPTRTRRQSTLQPPEFILFVNEPRLLGDTYRRYLEAQIRKAEPYPGLPVLIACRPRAEKRRA